MSPNTHTSESKTKTSKLALVVALALVVSLSMGAAAQDETGVVRSLPTQVDCTSGATFTVTLTVTPPTATGSWVVDEEPPAGVGIANVDGSNNGEYLEDQHRIKWLSLSGDAATHTYEVTVPSGTSDDTTLVFGGGYRFDTMEARAPIAGDTTVDCLPPCPGGPDGTYHPYDAAEDGLFDDDDLFALIDAWRLSDDGSLDDLLFAGIDAWKLSPDSYC